MDFLISWDRTLSRAKSTHTFIRTVQLVFSKFAKTSGSNVCLLSLFGHGYCYACLVKLPSLSSTEPSMILFLSVLENVIPLSGSQAGAVHLLGDHSWTSHQEHCWH